MTFSQWLAANKYDEAQLSDAQKKHLEAAWRAETQPTPPPNPTAEDRTPESEFARTMAFIEEKNRRIGHFQQRTAAAAAANVGNPEKVKQLRQLCDSAIAEVQAAKEPKDLKTDTRDFDLAVLRLDRSTGPMVLAPAAQQVNDDVVEAAICVAHKLPGVEKAFGEQTLEVAHKQFRRGVTLKRLLMMGARQNGFRGDESDWYGVCRAVMHGRGGDPYDMRADVGPSTGVQVPGILSNIANKFLASSFMNVEQSWRGIAKIRPVNDFKQITTYRMSGNNTFLRVAPSGEIKHGALSETSYTNQAKTYGRLLGISREDYINDDLGAFVSITQELGRGAADGFNNIFWATWLNDSTFFPTDKSKLNYDDGATDSVLSLAGLDNAEAIFAVQTKPDGTPLGATPRILLVPPALKNTALTLMTSFATNMATSSVALTGNQNIFAGRYNVVSSAFLPRTSLNDENGVSQTVTGSSTAWYLLADPMDIPCIEVVFLFGKDTPTVETDQFEFDRLGLATRAYFDFGVSLQEYRGGIKLKGAA